MNNQRCIYYKIVLVRQAMQIYKLLVRLALYKTKNRICKKILFFTKSIFCFNQVVLYGFV